MVWLFFKVQHTFILWLSSSIFHAFKQKLWKNVFTKRFVQDHSWQFILNSQTLDAARVFITGDVVFFSSVVLLVSKQSKLLHVCQCQHISGMLEWVKEALYRWIPIERFRLHEVLEQVKLMFACFWPGLKFDWEGAWGNSLGDEWWVMGHGHGWWVCSMFGWRCKLCRWLHLSLLIHI